tara:strand:- start:526 stop:900 length:375 start_codon:yes stop_codon:yes gene_type:complete
MSEKLPISEFSPQDRSIQVYVVQPEDPNYEKFQELFSEDAYGHGFCLLQHNLVIIDGMVKRSLGPDHMRAVEAHEVAHIVCEHEGYRIYEQEIEADKVAIDMLVERGYFRSAELLRERLKRANE